MPGLTANEMLRIMAVTNKSCPFCGRMLVMEDTYVKCSACERELPEEICGKINVANFGKAREEWSSYIKGLKRQKGGEEKEHAKTETPAEKAKSAREDAESAELNKRYNEELAKFRRHYGREPTWAQKSILWNAVKGRIEKEKKKADRKKGLSKPSLKRARKESVQILSMCSATCPDSKCSGRLAADDNYAMVCAKCKKIVTLDDAKICKKGREEDLRMKNMELAQKKRIAQRIIVKCHHTCPQRGCDGELVISGDSVVCEKCNKKISTFDEAVNLVYATWEYEQAKKKAAREKETMERRLTLLAKRATMQGNCREILIVFNRVCPHCGGHLSKRPKNTGVICEKCEQEITLTEARERRTARGRF